MENQIKFKRNEQGLIEGMDYKYKPNGLVDWRAMLLPEHLTINRQYEKTLTEKFNKPLNEIKTSELEDKHLLILLSGIKYIANLRGFISVNPNVVYVADNKVVVSTLVTWAGNFETNGLSVAFGDVGGASLENTTGFGQRYLEAIATNRAFARAVRNFLNINVVAQDEVDSKVLEEEAKTVTNSGATPLALLIKTVEKKSLNFEGLKAFALKNLKNLEFTKKTVEEWVDFNSIEPKHIFRLIQALNE